MADAANTTGASLQYLMQMAEELKKMARSAGAPSLALLFDMANDEARSLLAAGQSAAAFAAAAQAAGPAPAERGVRRRSIRPRGHHAAIMADKAAGKLKFHQTEI